MRLIELIERADEAGLTALERSTLGRWLGCTTIAAIAAQDGVSERAVRYRLQSATAKLAALYVTDRDEGDDDA